MRGLCDVSCMNTVVVGHISENRSYTCTCIFWHNSYHHAILQQGTSLKMDQNIHILAYFGTYQNLYHAIFQQGTSMEIYHIHFSFFISEFTVKTLIGQFCCGRTHHCKYITCLSKRKDQGTSLKIC